jgi:hypothetical protein
MASCSRVCLGGAVVTLARTKRALLRLLADGQRRSLPTICDKTDAFMPLTCYALRQLTAEGHLVAILRLRPEGKALRFYQRADIAYAERQQSVPHHTPLRKIELAS